jgi:hypothetical protein
MTCTVQYSLTSWLPSVSMAHNTGPTHMMLHASLPAAHDDPSLRPGLAMLVLLSYTPSLAKRIVQLVRVWHMSSLAWRHNPTSGISTGM